MEWMKVIPELSITQTWCLHLHHFLFSAEFNSRNVNVTYAQDRCKDVNKHCNLTFLSHWHDHDPDQKQDQVKHSHKLVKMEKRINSPLESQ